MPYFVLYLLCGNGVSICVYMQLQNIKSFIRLHWNTELNNLGCQLQ